LIRGQAQERAAKRGIFYALQEAKVLIEQWRRHYNTIRPQSALGFKPPAPQTIPAASGDLPFAAGGCGLLAARQPG
jgi:putative transposase